MHDNRRESKIPNENRLQQYTLPLCCYQGRGIMVELKSSSFSWGPWSPLGDPLEVPSPHFMNHSIRHSISVLALSWIRNSLPVLCAIYVWQQRYSNTNKDKCWFGPSCWKSICLECVFECFCCLPQGQRKNNMFFLLPSDRLLLFQQSRWNTQWWWVLIVDGSEGGPIV